MEGTTRSPLSVSFLLSKEASRADSPSQPRDSGELRIARRFPDLPQLDLSKLSVSNFAQSSTQISLTESDGIDYE